VRDLIGVLHMMVKEGVLPDLGSSAKDPELQAHIVRKGDKIGAFMRYARRVGALNKIPRLSDQARSSHSSGTQLSKNSPGLRGSGCDTL